LPTALGIVGQAAHADLDDLRNLRQLSGAQNPRRVIEIARRAVPGVEVRVNVDEGERLVESSERRISDAVIAANHNGERFVGEDGLYRGRDFVVGLRRDGRPDFDIADVGPALAFEHGAVAIDVVEAFGQIVVIFLRSFAHVARTVTFTGLSPGALVERYAKDGKVGVELFEVGDVGRAEKGSHSDEGGNGLGTEHRSKEQRGAEQKREKKRAVHGGQNRSTALAE
jgi:hypothetical protein